MEWPAHPPLVGGGGVSLFMIKIMIYVTLSNLLEFPFDYVPCSLFIGKGLILGWIPLVEMETNLIG